MAETSQFSVVTNVAVVRGRGENDQIGQIGLNWELFLKCKRGNVGGTVEWWGKRQFGVFEQVWGKGSRHGEKKEPKEKNPMAVLLCQHGQLERSVNFGGSWVVQQRELHNGGRMEARPGSVVRRYLFEGAKSQPIAIVGPEHVGCQAWTRVR